MWDTFKQLGLSPYLLAIFFMVSSIIEIGGPTVRRWGKGEPLWSRQASWLALRSGAPVPFALVLGFAQIYGKGMSNWFWVAGGLVLMAIYTWVAIWLKQHVDGFEDPAKLKQQNAKQYDLVWKLMLAVVVGCTAAALVSGLFGNSADMPLWQLVAIAANGALILWLALYVRKKAIAARASLD